MREQTYSRHRNMGVGGGPMYDDPEDVPLERDIRQHYRSPVRSRQSYHEQGYDTSGWPMVALGLGAGALLTWLATSSSSSQSQRGWSRNDTRNLPIDETHELIASNKVEGTAVYDRNGEKLGTVHNFMVGKRSGRVAYAVISFGGFLGLGEGYHPVPWNALTYDESRGGYVIQIEKERLRNAPKHQSADDAFSNPTYTSELTQFWGT
jgi:sporulation protein YlmC with PRC-barrel domain